MLNIVIIFLVAIVSFFLGRLSILGFPFDNNVSEISLEEIKGEYLTSREVFASKNGTKYYNWWCVSSKIKKENLETYTDEESAMSNGLTKSKQC